MALELNSRICGSVHVIECNGRIVAGAEGQALESALRQDWCRNLRQVVLHLAEVDFLDSTGMGLLVRRAASLRQCGGDLRLSHVRPAIMEVLRLTRIDSVVKVFPTEQEAILSFLSRDAAPQASRAGSGSILLVEQCPDFCAFATAALAQRGYEVKSASLVRDAKILLQVHKVNSILIGPSTRAEALDSIASTLKMLVPGTEVMHVNPELKHCDPHRATEALLEMLGSKTH